MITGFLFVKKWLKQLAAYLKVKLKPGILYQRYKIWVEKSLILIPLPNRSPMRRTIRERGGRMIFLPTCKPLTGLKNSSASIFQIMILRANKSLLILSFLSFLLLSHCAQKPPILPTETQSILFLGHIYQERNKMDPRLEKVKFKE